jgi:uncharacterized coiled-coil protein SlyX
MRVSSEHDGKSRIFQSFQRMGPAVSAAALLLSLFQPSLSLAQAVSGQPSAPATTEQKVEQLTAALAQAQAQMETYQKQLLDMRQQLVELQQQIAAEKGVTPSPAPTATTNTAGTEAPAGTPPTFEEIRERQAIDESQIATHDVTKVETESKYPLKVTGLLLFNAFVNTRQVDIPASPAYAIPGPGSTGLSLQQTVLGLDARGPHMLGASSYADLRVDFFASATQANYAAGGILRLRTAHAGVNWQNTEAFVELDRSILEPNAPSSLVAVAQPELAWAGNLWNWNPQVGVSHQFALSESFRVKAQGALIDTLDPQLPGSTPTPTSVTQSERSRWPGTEARIAFLGGESGVGPAIGVGGYFSPHSTPDGNRYDAWAGTMDLRLPLARHFELTINGHRGQALAGLGAGGYVNYYDQYAGSVPIAKALDDVGGWAQLKARAGQRVEMNAGYGADNPFAREIRAATSSSHAMAYDLPSYPGLARNRSVFSNVIYSPSAYLLFSLEYKRLWTDYGYGPAYFSDSIGIGAGYRF